VTDAEFKEIRALVERGQRAATGWCAAACVLGVLALWGWLRCWGFLR
jgi:hypothetical protein